MAGVNAEQFDAWNDESGQRWAASADRRDAVLAPVADALFAAVGLVPGESVLDIGCGCGATTLAAAEAVTEAGSVVGVDLSEPMLDVARRRATERDLRNVRFEQADVQSHVLPADSYDVALSRFGTMFFADSVAAFTNIAQAMRHGARLCLATWQPLAVNEWLTVPGTPLLRYGTPPELGTGPGMFAQSDPAALAATLTAAGFDQVESEPVTVSMRFGADVHEAANYLVDGGPGRAILDTISDEDRAAAMQAVREALTDHAGADGVRLAGAIFVTTATRRSG